MEFKYRRIVLLTCLLAILPGCSLPQSDVAASIPMREPEEFEQESVHADQAPTQVVAEESMPMFAEDYCIQWAAYDDSKTCDYKPVIQMEEHLATVDVLQASLQDVTFDVDRLIQEFHIPVLPESYTCAPPILLNMSSDGTAFVLLQYTAFWEPDPMEATGIHTPRAVRYYAVIDGQVRTFDIELTYYEIGYERSLLQFNGDTRGGTLVRFGPEESYLFTHLNLETMAQTYLTSTGQFSSEINPKFEAECDAKVMEPIYQVIGNGNSSYACRISDLSYRIRVVSLPNQSTICEFTVPSEDYVELLSLTDRHLIYFDYTQQQFVIISLPDGTSQVVSVPSDHAAISDITISNDLKLAAYCFSKEDSTVDLALALLNLSTGQAAEIKTPTGMRLKNVWLKNALLPYLGSS